MMDEEFVHNLIHWTKINLMNNKEETLTDE